MRSVDVENRRITLTHRELLGTWEENAALFAAGETVRGIVRSVEPYGVFIELAPNLSGLAENREGLTPGTPVSVYIKSILPQRMKIKLRRDRYSAAYRYARAAALFCLRRPYRPLGLYPGRLRQEIHRDRIPLNGSR